MQSNASLNALTNRKGVVEGAVLSEMNKVNGLPDIAGSTGAGLIMTPRDIANSKLDQTNGSGRSISANPGWAKESIIGSTERMLYQYGQNTIIITPNNPPQEIVINFPLTFSYLNQFVFSTTAFNILGNFSAIIVATKVNGGFSSATVRIDNYISSGGNNSPIAATIS